MFKKRKNKKNKEKASKRLKITEELEKDVSSEEEPISLSKSKNQKSSNLSKRAISASTIDEKTKKQKLWNEKTEVSGIKQQMSNFS